MVLRSPLQAVIFAAFTRANPIKPGLDKICICGIMGVGWVNRLKRTMASAGRQVRSTPFKRRGRRRRPKLTVADLRVLGEQVKLVWVGAETPKCWTERTEWQCLTCGRIYSRSASYLIRRRDYHDGYGCPCSNPKKLYMFSLLDYYALPGYIFLGKSAPKTVYEPTYWIDIRNREVIYASYRQLAYKVKKEHARSGKTGAVGSGRKRKPKRDA